jgi:hypothetical protein
MTWVSTASKARRAASTRRSMNFSSNSLQYDGYGRRTGKTISSATTSYLYDGANIVQELSGTTPTANLFTGGIDEYFTGSDSSWTANFLTDALGSTVGLADSFGTVQTEDRGRTALGSEPSSLPPGALFFLVGGFLAGGGF